LFATAGRPEPEVPLLPVGPRVAMAVGKTNEGESLPANPTQPWSVQARVSLGAVYSTQLRVARAAGSRRQHSMAIEGGSACRQLGAYLSMTTAGVWDAIAAAATLDTPEWQDSGAMHVPRRGKCGWPTWLCCRRGSVGQRRVKWVALSLARAPPRPALGSGTLHSTTMENGSKYIAESFNVCHSPPVDRLGLSFSCRVPSRSAY